MSQSLPMCLNYLQDEIMQILENLPTRPNPPPSEAARPSEALREGRPRPCSRGGGPGSTWVRPRQTLVGGLTPPSRRLPDREAVWNLRGRGWASSRQPLLPDPRRHTRGRHGSHSAVCELQSGAFVWLQRRQRTGYLCLGRGEDADEAGVGARRVRQPHVPRHPGSVPRRTMVARTRTRLGSWT